MKHKKIYADGKYVPQRMCVACRQVKPKIDMLRITSLNGGVILDTKGNKGGRGCYICNDTSCIERAKKIRGPERSLKADVPVGIYEECINIDK